MKLKQQVTSLEISQRISKLGVKQESLFFYGDGEIFYSERHTRENEDISAYTVAELGEMIKGHEWGGDLVGWPIVTIRGFWRVNLDDEGMLCSTETEAAVRGLMLCHLIESGVLKASEL